MVGSLAGSCHHLLWLADQPFRAQTKHRLRRERSPHAKGQKPRHKRLGQLPQTPPLPEPPQPLLRLCGHALCRSSLRSSDTAKYEANSPAHIYGTN